MTEVIKDKVYGIDVPPVSHDEALELMMHHLSMAQAYFEATPDADTTILEVLRITGEKELHGEPIRAWYNSMYDVYEQMKELD